MNVGTIAGMLLLSERFAGIGVWSKPQIVFMLSYTYLVRSLLDVFFNFNVLFISRRLGRGQFDHTLIQPQPLWMSLLTEGFTPIYGTLMLWPGIALMIWSLLHLTFAVTAAWYALLFLNILASLIVVLSFQFLSGSLAFYAPHSAEEINSTTMRLFNQLKSFPLDGLGGMLTTSLLVFLPIGFMGWYPCRALLGIDRNAWAVWMTPLASILFAAAACFMFQRGLIYYGRTGSQRYLGRGHRS